MIMGSVEDDSCGLTPASLPYRAKRRLDASIPPRIFDLRHAYLHYLLDPLATRNMEVLNRKKSLVDHAMRAQGLSDSFKEDFLLLVTESLIKAVEARLDHKPAMVQDALREGHILAPYFAEALPAYEKQEQSMMLYYTGMVQGIDLIKEDKRLTGLEFNKQPAERPARTVTVLAPQPAPLTGAAKTLADAKATADAQVKAARAALEKETSEARTSLQAEAESLSAAIVRTVLKPVGAAMPAGGVQ